MSGVSPKFFAPKYTVDQGVVFSESRPCASAGLFLGLGLGVDLGVFGSSVGGNSIPSVLRGGGDGGSPVGSTSVLPGVASGVFSGGVAAVDALGKAAGGDS